MGSRTLLAVAVAALVLRSGLCLRDLAYLDRLFIPDDTYYTLSIARHLAWGDGPTAHGGPLTNGFQALTAFLLVPFCRLLPGPDGPLRAALVLSALADVATVVLLGRLAARASRRPERAAFLAALAWAVSPVAIANALNGLETSLAVACQLAFVDAVLVAREAKAARRWSYAGAIAGLAMLARVDSVFVVAGIGAFELSFGDRRGVLRAGAVGLLVVAPWWSYQLVRFHTVVPGSGAAVRQHVIGSSTLATQLGWAAGYVVGTPFVDLSDLRAFALFHPPFGVALFISVALGLAWAGVRAFRGRPPLQILALAAVTLLVFYATYLPALYFFKRYLAPVLAVTALLIAVLVAEVPTSARARNADRIAALGLLAACAIGLVASVPFFLLRPATSVEGGLHGLKGYRTPAQQIVGLAPPGSVIGALQSGALGWYAIDRPVTIVNLDGVVDAEARKAYREGTLNELAIRRSVTHLADWPFNLDTIAKRSTRPFRARLLGKSSPQDPPAMSLGLSFMLLQVDWGS